MQNICAIFWHLSPLPPTTTWASDWRKKLQRARSGTIDQNPPGPGNHMISDKWAKLMKWPTTSFKALFTFSQVQTKHAVYLWVSTPFDLQWHIHLKGVYLWKEGFICACPIPWGCHSSCGFFLYLHISQQHLSQQHLPTKMGESFHLRICLSEAVNCLPANPPQETVCLAPSEDSELTDFRQPCIFLIICSKSMCKIQRSGIKMSKRYLVYSMGKKSQGNPHEFCVTNMCYIYEKCWFPCRFLHVVLVLSLGNSLQWKKHKALTLWLVCCPIYSGYMLPL